MVQPTFTKTGCDVCGSSDSIELIQLYGSAYHECQQCGLIYANPMISNLQDVAEENLTQNLKKYTDKIKAREEKYRRFLKRYDRYRKTGNFLEIGCNAGAVLNAARANGWNAKGLDLSAVATTYARDHLGLDVFTGTVEQAAYPSDYFDVIYTNDVIEHVLHPLSLMKECQRILRPGGIFYADTVNWDSYTQQILGGGWRLLDPVHHVHLYTPRNVKSLCEHAGLELVKVWTTGVRIQANAAEYRKNLPWYMHLAKGPLSLMTRFTKKGDSIEFIARKQ